MASRRKDYTPQKKTRSAASLFNEFIKDLLAATIAATKLIAQGSPKKPKLRYDDPNG